METKQQILVCAICGNLFECDHVIVNEAFGEVMKHPHCKKCFFSETCPDNHGFQCPKCQDFAPEFNP